MNFFKNHKRLTGVAIFGLVLAIFWVVRANAAAARLQRVESLKAQLDSEESKKLAPEKRKELFQQYNVAMKSLSSSQRQVLFDKAAQKGQQRIDQFFKLTRQQQFAQLDKEINQMEQQRKQWEHKKKAGGPASQTFAKGPAGPKGASSTPQERERRRKEALNRSTAEERARRTEYFKMLNDRRVQRGLPAMGTKGGGKR